MADIEAEIEKILPCHTINVCGLILDGVDYRCENCRNRPSMAEFCRKLVADQHDENCDTRDTMIQGKPCNCYVILRAKVAELEQEIVELNIHRDGFRQTIREFEQEHKQVWLINKQQLNIIAELEQELGVGRELVAAQLKAIEIVESQLAAERADNADLSEGIDGMILDRDYFEGKLKAAEAEIAKLKDSNIRLSEARSRWR